MSNTPPPPPNFGNQIPLPSLVDAAKAIGDLTNEIKNLKTALTSLGGASSGPGAQVGNIFKNLQGQANSASSAMKTLFSQMTGARPGGQSIGSLLDYGIAGDFGHDIAMFPLRFMQSTFSANRQLAYNSASALSGMQYAQGASERGIFGALGGQMSGARGRYGLRGTADEISQTFATARQYGAMYDFATPAGTAQPGVRTEGFFRGTAELANMYPGASLPGLAQTLGGFSANTAAQQRSLFMSGGAFGMVGQGGAQKTVSQWAESIINFMEDQRMGATRGTPFTYPELLSQNFPGSNIDAWLDANAVPPDMKEAWWNYALNKAKSQGNTGGVGIDVGVQKGNLAYQRSRAVSATTRGQFTLAQNMNSAYRSREGANTRFNTQMGSFINANLTGSGMQDVIARIPDTLEEFIMQILENSGVFGSIIGAGVGYGSVGLNLFSNLFSQAGGLIGGAGVGFADILAGMSDEEKSQLANQFAGSGMNPEQLANLVPGDVGDTGWGAMGARGTGSLHPDVGSKINRMMRANPRLRMNSGRRDEVTQRSLRAKGHSRVSGKSSAHTRGLAADLGPASEYGWLMANASRFGLQSGAKHGEPWHVGMSGIGDTTSDKTGILSLFSKMFGTEGTSLADVEGILPAFFTLLSPKGTGAALTESQAEERYKLDISTLAAGKYEVGGKWGGTDFADAIRAAMAGTQGGGGGGGGGAANNAATLEAAVKALGKSSTGLSSGAMVAILANAAGFTGQDLVTAVAIAQRESGFDPLAHRTDKDKSFVSGDRGLWQINYVNDPTMVEAGLIDRRYDPKIFNPYINAQAARLMWQRSGNTFAAWNMGPGGWDANGSPTYGTDVNEATGYVKEAGLGDLEGGGGGLRIGGSRMTFNNTFVLSGGSGGANSGIDVRRTASQIADQLEREMRGRLERVN